MSMKLDFDPTKLDNGFRITLHLRLILGEYREPDRPASYLDNSNGKRSWYL